MKFTQLRDLISIAERGGLRRAARHLGLAQPALSKSIRELEHELGAPLFERTTTGMTLTPIGQAFLKRSTAIQLEVQRAFDEVQQLRGSATGTVSVGMSTSSQIAMLPRVLRPFESRYPDILLRISEGLFPVMENEVRQGAIDFYVGPPGESEMPKEFSVENLFDNRRVVAARPGHSLGEARSIKELVDARWVVTSVTAINAAELNPFFDRYGLPQPKIVVEAHGAMAAIMAAASSDLLAMLPQQCLDFAERASLLKLVPLEEVFEAPPVCIVSRTALPLTPAAQHLADLFRRAALNRNEPLHF